MRRMTRRMMAWGSALVMAASCLATGAWARTWVLSVAVAGSMTPQDERHLYVPSYYCMQELAGKAGFPKNRLPQPGVSSEDVELHFYGLAVKTDRTLGGNLRVVTRSVSLDIPNADRKDIEVTEKPRPNSPFDPISKADLKGQSLSYLTEGIQPEWDGLIVVADGVEVQDFNSYDKKHRFLRVVRPDRSANQVREDRLRADIRAAAEEFVSYVDSQCKVDVPTVRFLEESKKIYPGQDVRFEVTSTNAEKIAVSWGDMNKGTQAGGSKVAFKHVYKKSGRYAVAFTAARGSKESEPVEMSVVVSSLPPRPTLVVSDEAPRIRVGEEKLLLIRCSGEDFTGTLDLGVFGGQKELLRGQNITLKYDIPGSYDILAEARNMGGVTQKCIRVTVVAADPVVELLGVRRDGLKVDVQYQVRFADSARLSFGDGSAPLTVAQDGRKEHTYGAGGEYTVTLEAGEVRRSVRVEVAEQEDPDEPVLGLYGAEADKDGTVTVSYQASNVTRAELQFGDGTPAEQVQGEGGRTHAYKNGGHYQIRLLAEKDGKTLEPKVIELDVEGPEILPPVLDLYGLRTDGLDVEVTTYVMNTPMAMLDFGDGTEAVQVEAGEYPVTHHYDVDGDYMLTLACEGGTPATKEVSVEAPLVEPLRVRVEVRDVNGEVLSADSSGQIHAHVGAALQFAGVVVAGTAGKFSWNFGDRKAESSARKPRHQFAAAGTYVVRLQAWPETDEDEEYEEEPAAESKVTVVVAESSAGGVVWLILLVLLGVGGWVGAQAARRCPMSVYVEGKKAGRFSLLKNDVTLPGTVTNVGEVTLKARKKGVVSMKVAEEGLKVRCGAVAEEKGLIQERANSLRELFGEAVAESTHLTLSGKAGAKCEIELK